MLLVRVEKIEDIFMVLELKKEALIKIHGTEKFHEAFDAV